MTLVKPKAATREAWQYTGQPRGEWPGWVRGCCMRAQTMGGELQVHLWRRSGMQILNPSEWLVQSLDGEPEWLTHEQMRKTFDEVVG